MNAALWIVLLAAHSLGQAPRDAARLDDKAEAAQARAAAKLMAAEYVFQLDQASGQKLQQQPEPILRWLLQLDRHFHSDVYLWTHEARPVVVAAITNVYGDRRIMETEIHSLSTGLPLLLHNQQVAWQPERAGVEWKPLPGAPQPGATAAARLTQMRGLAAQYSVSGVYAKMKEELRLLPAPVYRYASPKQGVTDGALFAFARGTDPDAFLMIEAREPAPEAAAARGEYQFALVRFCSHCSLRAQRDGQDVWQVDVLPTTVILDPKQPYFALRKYSDFPDAK